ncbi:MAG TPA: amidase [Geminicoccaceae bacterium]|nr:amidase [Geminicoccaceae bacterium]
MAGQQSQDLAHLPATELLALYRARRLSPVEATRAALERIAEHDGAVNAFCLVDEDGALAAARASEARWQRGEPCGLVDGVPATVKDVMLTKGWPTLRGSRAIPRDQPWEEDAPIVARLREHGAVFLGKTTTPEFGWKGVTDSPLTGITRNPWDTRTTPGGSSGGAAAAAALGMGALHTGSDGGGSIRIPAGFTGIFGHKPSYGRVPAYPASPYGSISHHGPMTRTVRDAALMMNVIALPDGRDWTALPYDARDWRIGLEDGVRGLRVAFSPRLGLDSVRVDPEIARLVADAARVFEDLGAVVEEADPDLRDAPEVFRTHWSVGSAFALHALSEEQRAVMDPGLLEVAAEGGRVALPDYLHAASRRAAIGRRMNRFHDAYDLLLSPTLPLPAFPAGREVADPTTQPRWYDWTPFSYPFNLTQQPACTVPCGFTGAGLPAGLQIVGRRYDDALVLRAARAFEAVRPFVMPGAPRTAT